MRTHIVIIGGGLAGLLAARLLERRGIDEYVVLEARETCGGRILTTEGGFDLGATWFWPELQPELATLIERLALQTFAQHEAGDLMWERSAAQPAERVRGFVSSPASMRLHGGMASLVDAVRRSIPPTRIRPGCRVRSATLGDGCVELRCDGPTPEGSDRPACIGASHVLLAVPPRLAMQSIDFAPALPDALVSQWRSAATWMAPHAKYLATYDEPFWRAAGLSGAARSAAGPLGEIHDACEPGAGVALFGFFGLPAGTRSRVSEAALRATCRAQLARLFGPRAAHPTSEWLKDWAADACTATPADQLAQPDHAAAAPSAAQSGPWAGRLVGAASEWSPRFPGYVAGALDAAHRGVERLLATATWGRPTSCEIDAT